MKISIITPTFNSEKDIESCILSVVNQTYKNIEHLIIDGLSTDRTIEIVKKYAQRYPHIKLISEKDNGIYDAMNKGIDLASGEWIYFLGSDDVFFDNNVLLDISRNLENVDVLYGNVKFKISGEIYAGEFSKSKLIEKNICHQAIFFKKIIFDILGKFETKYKGLADWAFNMKWLNNKKIRYKFINRIVAVYNEDGYSFNNPDIEFAKDKEKIIKREFFEIISMNWKCYNPNFEYNKSFDDVGLHWAGHKNFAYDIVSNIRPKLIVELGTWKGTSFFSFCQAAKDLEIDLKLYAVDTWEGDLHMGKFDDCIYKNLENLSKQYYNAVDYFLLKTTFDKAVINFKNDSIDILHIDGLHTYKAVKHDFYTWLPKMSSNGIILFHDIEVCESNFGVYRLWNELKKEYKTIEFYHSFGLGVLFLDGEHYKDMIIKMEEFQMHYSYIHEMNRVNKIQEISLLNEQKDQEIQNQTNIIQQKDQEIQNQTNIIQQKDQEIQNQTNIIQQKDQEIQNQTNIIQQKDQEINFVKSSKFWKARGRYLSVKKKLSINKKV